MKPKVSIIILNWNTLSWLKKCVESIAFSDMIGLPQIEVIIVDNGSTEEGTKEYIKEHSDKHIFNENNLGFAKGNNQGSEIAEGEYLCFLNSDTIVTNGWLNDLLNTYESNPKCGAVGPLGNTQCRIIQGKLYQYTQYIGQTDRDTKVNFLSGFCILIKKELFDKIKWSEEFEYGLFEDNLLSEQLKKLGYELWISANSYVIHPYPSRSFSNNNLNYEDLYNTNQQNFVEKIKEIQNDK